MISSFRVHEERGKEIMWKLKILELCKDFIKKTTRVRHLLSVHRRTQIQNQLSQTMRVVRVKPHVLLKIKSQARQPVPKSHQQNLRYTRPVFYTMK
jgi:hypothetical protein